ncbi:hypothetical protein JAAARDRAFT_400689 [Jaapia argillacea MUCL 33604]|uniref:Uncharacterized protein n=1 Tax=Jaapia argillacea MUCL 33604 TaxID=933084 RepID=A0A067PWB9_9AGAM|nr:hypothetical protein JAAARDRAFT_400689 [Jaapia argillacea MUCL 33604]
MVMLVCRRWENVDVSAADCGFRSQSLRSFRSRGRHFPPRKSADFLGPNLKLCIPLLNLVCVSIFFGTTRVSACPGDGF